MITNAEPIVREYAKAWSSQDIDRILSFFTEDCEFEDVAMKIVSHGKDELKAFLAETFRALPDFKMEIRRIVVAGDVTTFEWIASATSAGAFGAFPPTGKSYTIKAATILDFHGSIIHRAADYWDLASSLKQLGYLTEDFIP
jgi:steroid delta-isomerase-like uncharacterized protein